MKKILITGSEGNLGTRIFNYESKLDFDCIFLSRKEISKNHRGGKNIHVKADITLKDSINKELWGATEVFHMAGATHEKNTDNYYLNNFETTKLLIDLAIKNNVSRFIYLSTQAIGKIGGAYSHSKQLAEDYLKHSRLNWTILRPSEVYGESIESPITSLCNSIKHKKVIPIIGNGKYTVNPLHIQDLRKFIHKLLDCPSDKSHRKIYTLCGPNPISFEDFCKRCSAPSKHKLHTLKIPVSICKFGLLIASKMKFTSLNYDQIDRLIMQKNNDIQNATDDYTFKPRHFKFNQIYS